jgi:excisionase family DNA binding protein
MKQKHTNTNPQAPVNLACAEAWIGTAAAAKHLGTSIPTFRRWIKSGLVSAKRTPTGELRFRRSELDKLIG